MLRLFLSRAAEVTLMALGFSGAKGDVLIRLYDKTNKVIERHEYGFQ